MFDMGRDEEEAKAMAVMELLHLDMKFSKSELSEMETGNCRTKVRIGRNGLEVWRKRGEEMEYSQVPLKTLGDLPEISMVRRVERQEERSMTRSPPPGRPGYTPPSARGKQGGREVGIRVAQIAHSQEVLHPKSQMKGKRRNRRTQRRSRSW